MSAYSEQDRVIGDGSITRREAIQRVSMLLGGTALVGGSALLTGCRDDKPETRAAARTNGTGTFSPADVAFLDEVADTILPPTRTPGAKAAQTGAFMAVMVTDTYDARDQQVFREGMRKLDQASQQMHQVGFMQATPQQRLALLQRLDQEQKTYMDARAAAGKPQQKPEAAQADTAEADAYLPDQRQENAAVGQGEANPAPGITADAPPHYFRMMKELALLGYFTSEIGYNQAQRYMESPGRFDPCTPYKPGDRAWAPHA